MSLKKLFILRAFAMDYHSGQWSRGYKILSLAGMRLRANGIESSWETDQKLNAARRTKLYKELVEKYGSKV